ncbi:primosomal protein N' [Bacillus solimangrovi]|uniref:Replication restart protein PriA n=1 Tax=Bacillus solimangrovi TaxID=1305675 RepID=A0A1E5LAW4_9BACI|nr:primosomal protein N' [Bacillus solimangrovi]OEH91211.1 primosomal protein N' [Bacillus solimangrovi]
MKIAKVIVDVASNQTDRPFDYLIPALWTETARRGMRVIVPFGPRKVQGFIVDVTDTTDVGKLKEIESFLDVTPVINEELLKMSYWLADQTLCFRISALQAMLPAAMKSKYEKVITLADCSELNDLPDNLRPFFKDQRIVKWKEIEQVKGIITDVQRAVSLHLLEIIYVTKAHTKKKTIRTIEPVSTEKLTQGMQGLSKHAKKQIQVVEYFIENPNAIPLAQLVNTLNTTDAPVKALIEKGLLKETSEEVYRDPFQNRTFKKTERLDLTEQQQRALNPINETVENNKHEVFLVYGVTGSGKTEVYLQAIEAVLEQGKEAIVLVPEISLTPMMVERFKGRFGDQVAVLHSALSAGEKYDEWRKILRKEVKVVVGARSAIFAPFENIGIIIIDEEHESSYKQEENPRYHARDAAIYRGEYHRCPVILGSATPALESFARAQKGVYKLLSLTKRIQAREMPKVEIIDMREELHSGNRSMFSTRLFDQLKDRLERGEQSVLFLNRRGFSTFVICRDCGFVIECPHCDISLTYHKRGHQLKCHYCSYEQSMPTVCPECSGEHIRFFGTGTQKVEEELAKVLPEAKVIRMDVDTTRKKGAHEKLLTAFGQKKADILLGTQMIAKGLDFPDVTLVGVLAADAMLHIPDFRASEKTFQLLTQVSGRAGRHKLPGEVVIQTYTPEHYSVTAAAQHDFDRFYEQEMLLRKRVQYPPYYYITLITVSHPEVTKAAGVTDKIAEFLRSQLSSQAIILGPVTSAIARVKDRYRYQCMIKYKSEPNLLEALHAIMERYKQEISRSELQVSIDLNPYMMM